MNDTCNDGRMRDTVTTADKRRDARHVQYRDAVRRNDDTIADLVLCDLNTGTYGDPRSVLLSMAQSVVDVTAERIRSRLRDIPLT